MGTGISIFFIAVGAVLTFAVDTPTSGVDLDAIGVILMVVGILGLLFTLVLLDDWRPGPRRRSYVDEGDREVVVRRDPVVLDEEPVVRRSVTRRSYH